METVELIIDSHADTLLKRYMSPMRRMFNAPGETNYHITKELMQEGASRYLQVFALFIPPKMEKMGIEITLELIAEARTMQHEEGIPLIRSKSDYNRCKEANTYPAMVLSMEGAMALERNPKLLPVFYDLGIRMISLAWSRKNWFAEGSSFTDPNHEGDGLSKHGFELIEQMDDLGIICDVSHINEKGFDDIIRTTKNPIVASHSNAANLCPIKRNLTDSQIEAIASCDGVIGINFYNNFLTKENPESVTINNVIEHIRYIADLVGVNHVGLGSDFDGISKVPKGLENASKVKKIPPLLENGGFSSKDIALIMGLNFERVFKKVWK